MEELDEIIGELEGISKGESVRAYDLEEKKQEID